MPKNKEFVKNGHFEENMTRCIESLKWIMKSSEYLGKKNNMKEIHHLDDKTDTIPRNSYRFCDYNYRCFIDKKKRCTGQHFVYNLIKADIDSILFYINHCINDKQPFNNDELIKSINTISFVINHMLEEMRKIDNEKKKKFYK